MADIMRDAQKRIEDIRRRTVKIVVRRDGSPVPDAQVELRMNRHQFLFGWTSKSSLPIPTQW